MGCASSSTAQAVKEAPQAPPRPVEPPLTTKADRSAEASNSSTTANPVATKPETVAQPPKVASSEPQGSPQTSAAPVTAPKVADTTPTQQPSLPPSSVASEPGPTATIEPIPERVADPVHQSVSDGTKPKEPRSLTVDTTSSPKKRKPPSKKTERGFIDFQSFLEMEEVKDLMNEFTYLLDDQLLEVFEVFDDDEDGLVTGHQADEIVCAIRGREQQQPATSSSPSSPLGTSASPVSPPQQSDDLQPTQSQSPTTSGTATKAKKVLKPLVYSPEPPTTPKKSLKRGNSSMAIEKGIILNDFVAETTSAPVSPPPQVKRGFLVTSSSNSPLSSPSRPNSTTNSRTPSLGIRSRFHVLDQGILYHLDSNVTSGPVALDKHGVSLRGHTVITTEPDSNLIMLSTKGIIDEEEDEVITLEVKNEQDRQGWVRAIQEHIDYISEQELVLRRQLLN